MMSVLSIDAMSKLRSYAAHMDSMEADLASFERTLKPRNSKAATSRAPLERPNSFSASGNVGGGGGGSEGGVDCPCDGSVIHRRADYGGDSSDSDLLKIKGMLAQMHGELEKLQCASIDAVMTGPLTSGKSDAKV